MIHWMLRVSQANFSGNCRDVSSLLCQPLCGHSPALHEMFPGNCSDTAQKLPGDFPDDSPDASWTAAVITKSFANHRADFGADIHRRFVRRLPPTARTRLGNCPDVPG
jgi:hypothetical protein